MLLAIVFEGPSNEPLAAVYDPVADRIVVVRTGDRILGRDVVSVDPAGISMRMGTTESRLRLDDQIGSGR